MELDVELENLAIAALVELMELESAEQLEAELACAPMLRRRNVGLRGKGGGGRGEHVALEWLRELVGGEEGSREEGRDGGDDSRGAVRARSVPRVARWTAWARQSNSRAGPRALEFPAACSGLCSLMLAMGQRASRPVGPPRVRAARRSFLASLVVAVMCRGLERPLCPARPGPADSSRKGTCRSSPALVSPLGTPLPRRPLQQGSPKGGNPSPQAALRSLALACGPGPLGDFAWAKGPGPGLRPHALCSPVSQVGRPSRPPRWGSLWASRA